METVKLDNRYEAYRKYGYEYCLKICTSKWRKYHDLKKVAVNMFGESIAMGRGRDNLEILNSAPWAWQHGDMRRPTHIYFRKEQDLKQVVMLWALTNNEINN